MGILFEYPLNIVCIAILLLLLLVIIIIIVKKSKGHNKELSKEDAEHEKLINEYMKEEKKKAREQEIKEEFNVSEPIKTVETVQEKIEENNEIEEIEGEDEDMFIKRKKKPTSTTKPAVTPKKEEPVSTKRTLNGKYEVFSENGEYKYVLKASNGEILVESELYSSKDSVLGAIDAVKRNLETGKVSISKDKRDLHQFKLTASNNRTLVVSANYTSKQNAEKALESFKRFALNSPIVEVEAPKDAFGEEIIVEKAEVKLNGKLVISGEGKGFVFKLLASNGELLCTSQPYSTKANCEKGVDTLKLNVNEGSFFIYKDKNGLHQFKLYSKTHRLIAIGQTYEDKQRAVSSANSVASFIDDAEIVKE